MFFSSLPASGEGDSPTPTPYSGHKQRGSSPGPETNFYCKMGTLKPQRGQVWPLFCYGGAEPARKWLDGELKLFVF